MGVQPKRGRGLTWSLGGLLGGGVLAFGLDRGRVQHPRRGAVLAKVVLQAFDGAVELVGADLEVHVHEIYGKRGRWGGIKTCNYNVVYLIDRIVMSRLTGLLLMSWGCSGTLTACNCVN